MNPIIIYTDNCKKTHEFATSMCSTKILSVKAGSLTQTLSRNNRTEQGWIVPPCSVQ